jgi:hypothetical protein
MDTGWGPGYGLFECTGTASVHFSRRRRQQLFWPIASIATWFQNASNASDITSRLHGQPIKKRNKLVENQPAADLLKLGFHVNPHLLALHTTLLQAEASHTVSHFLPIPIIAV